MSSNDITAAARLLRYALSPKERPTANSYYRELLDRYRSDVGFAETTDSIAEGLGLDVYRVSQLGLLVAGRVESPFGVTLDNCGLPITKSAGPKRLQDRRCFGVVLLGIITYAYPNGQALIDVDNRPLRAVDLIRFIDHTLGDIAGDDVEEDIGEAEGQLTEAVRAWRDLPEVVPTESGRTGKNSHRWYVEATLKFLVDQGRARRETALDDSTGEAYVLNDRFRIGLSEVAESLIGALGGADVSEAEG